MFRRDVGIWAGLTGCLHVGFGLQSHFGGRIARYFFLDRSGWVPDLSPFGLANWFGAVATLIVVGLLLLSNNLSLRILGARRWKTWQRSNYLLMVLTILHTFGYQLIEDRGRATVVLTFGAVLGVGLLQLLGFLMITRRWLHLWLPSMQL